MVRITLEPGGTGLRVGAARVTWTLLHKWHVSLELGSRRLYEGDYFTEAEAKDAALALARDLAVWIGAEQTGQGEQTEQVERETSSPATRPVPEDVTGNACPSCGKVVSSDRIYCTPKCRQRGYRLRKRAHREQQDAEAVPDQSVDQGALA